MYLGHGHNDLRVYQRHIQQVMSSTQHQVEVDKARWMTADRMLTGRLGPVSEHGSRVVKFVFTDTAI